MKPGDLRQLTPEELQARIRRLRDQLLNLRVKHATGQLDSTAGLQSTRRDLARALTVRTQGAEAK